MAERRDERIHTERVVLDVGQDTGALIIYTGEGDLGREIEVSLRGQDHPRTHTDVVCRDLNGRIIFTAVFPELPAGDYTIWGAKPPWPDSATIVGSQVTEISWWEGR